VEPLLGNEAIARGAVEAGVDVTAAYPGTPSTEIGEALAEAARELGFYFEWSANEKVAVEVAAAAAWSGLRSMCFMKHVGVNVASDALFTLAYAGVVGGMVVVSADDPHAHSSQNEQDNRYYAVSMSLPMLEPSNPQEAKDLTVRAFDLSERYSVPFLVRSTTRVSHVRAPVRLGEVRARRGKGDFRPPEPDRYLQVGAIARKHHAELLEKLERIEAEAAGEFARVEGEGEFGIVTSGVGYLYALEAVKLLGVEVKVLKLGMTHPLPERILSEFLEGVERVLVVEELEPFLEDRVRAVAKDANPELEVLGKRSGHLPRVGEYNAEVVVRALAEGLGESPPVDFEGLRRRASEVLERLPPRPPVLCPACPHRATGYAMKRALGSRPVYLNDIGCYALLFQKPFELAHVTHAMGSSMGFASGIDVATDRIPVVLIGDSTFFHAGIPALINAIHQKRRVIVAVLDNRITAMTGHQPHPGVPRRATGEEATPIDIERLVRGLGVDFVRVVDPYDFKETERAFREAEKHGGVAVVVCRRECALLTAARVRRERGRIVPYRVDPERCTYCRVCIMTYACPAFVDAGDRVERDPAVGFGCGSCVPVCPYGAIVPSEGAVDWRRDGYGV